MRDQPHYETLDMLRGVAAISVVLFHSSDRLMHCGYLAVDLFFMLSGFVIAHSYKLRLEAGMSVKNFVARRIIRLYPMIFAGSVVGLLAVFIQCALIHDWSHIDAYAVAFFKSLALFPQIAQTAIGKDVFPINSVFWSLFFEFAVNIAYASFLFRLRLAILAALAAVSFTMMLAFDLGGNFTSTFLLGFPRATFGFLTGVLIFEFPRAAQKLRISCSPLALAAALALIFLCPYPLTYEEVAPVFPIFVLIICAAVGSRPEKTNSWAKIVGDISYPLYALHIPIYLSYERGLQHIGVDTHAHDFLVSLGGLLLAATASYAALRLYDEPLRRRLARAPKATQFRDQKGKGRGLDETNLDRFGNCGRLAP